MTNSQKYDLFKIRRADVLNALGDKSTYQLVRKDYWLISTAAM